MLESAFSAARKLNKIVHLGAGVASHFALREPLAQTPDMRSAAEFRAPRGIPYHTRYATRSAPKTRQSALETPDATALYRGDWPGPVADLQTYSTNCAQLDLAAALL